MDEKIKKRLLAVREGIRWLEEEADGLRYVDVGTQFDQGMMFADLGALVQALVRVESDIDQIVDKSSKGEIK